MEERGYLCNGGGVVRGSGERGNKMAEDEGRKEKTGERRQKRT